jgi:phosphate-selective porin OprO/OprP
MNPTAAASVRPARSSSRTWASPAIAAIVLFAIATSGAAQPSVGPSVPAGPAPESAPAVQDDARAPQRMGGVNDGVVFQSSDGEYRLRIGLLLQADGRFAFDDSDGSAPDTFAIRRLRPTLRGRIGPLFEFYVNPDFADGSLSLQDAYIDTRFSPALVVRFGKMKTPFGLERLQSIGNTLFMELALPSALVPNRDVGVQVLGEIAGGLVSYAAAVLNGVPGGGSADRDSNDGKDVAGRVTVRPFGKASRRPLSGLTVGMAATTGEHSEAPQALHTPILLETFAEYPGVVSDGRLNRYSPQASYYFKSIGAFGEYVHDAVPVIHAGRRQDISHDAWQIAGSYVLAGGAATDRGVRPTANFDLSRGHLGALQVAARYHTLREHDGDPLDGPLDAGGSSLRARAWTVGLNWFPSPYIRYVVNFERTLFERTLSSVPRPANGLAVRGQVSF